jgi:hypothetical protein
MSHRIGESSPELTLMAAVIDKTYRQWGYPVPDAVRELAHAVGPAPRTEAVAGRGRPPGPHLTWCLTWPWQ